MQRLGAKQLHHVQSPDDDWVDIKSREERKKRQNRLNQRARRLRKEEESNKIQTFTKDNQPFRVQRWRVGASHTNQTQSSSVTNPLPAVVKSSDAITVSLRPSTIQLDPVRNLTVITSPPTFDFPLSPDHLLLTLIHFNVFRALTSNKVLLAKVSTLRKPLDQGPVPLLPSFTEFCDGLTIIEPIEDANLPPFLYPTTLQRNQPHSSWINMFPFPRFRDNLILFEGTFDAVDLVVDLLGDMVAGNQLPESTSSSTSSVFDGFSEFDEDSFAGGRRGLITWGQAWDRDGWEVTPGFLKKWAWLLGGCNDMIESANRWRATRDEPPLPLILGSALSPAGIESAAGQGIISRELW